MIHPFFSAAFTPSGPYIESGIGLRHAPTERIVCEGCFDHATDALRTDSNQPVLPVVSEALSLVRSTQFRRQIAERIVLEAQVLPHGQAVAQVAYYQIATADLMHAAGAVTQHLSYLVAQALARCQARRARIERYGSYHVR